MDPLPSPPAVPPVTFNELKDLIASRANTLPSRLQQCAAYALSEPDEIAFGTVVEIASQAGVQPSTLVRFAQALGYSGFTGLQQVFRSRLTNRWPDYRERLSVLKAQKAEGAAQLLDGFADTAMNSIIRLREECDTVALDQAVATLAEAETIYVLGLRRSFAVSAYLAYAFSKLKIRSVMLDHAGALLREQSEFLTTSDALMVVTFMPYTPEVIDFTSLVYGRGVPVVAITDNPLSPVARVASTILEVNEADLGSFRSLSATLCLSMVLAVAVGESRARAAAAPSVQV